MLIQLGAWTLHLYKHRQSGTERHAKWRKKAVKQKRCVVCGSYKLAKNKFNGKPIRKCEKCRNRECYLKYEKRIFNS